MVADPPWRTIHSVPVKVRVNCALEQRPRPEVHEGVGHPAGLCRIRTNLSGLSNQPRSRMLTLWAPGFHRAALRSRKAGPSPRAGRCRARRRRRVDLGQEYPPSRVSAQGLPGAAAAGAGDLAVAMAGLRLRAAIRRFCDGDSARRFGNAIQRFGDSAMRFGDSAM